MAASPYDRIKDHSTLQSFLQEQDEKELRSRQGKDLFSLTVLEEETIHCLEVEHCALVILAFTMAAFLHIPLKLKV